MFYMILSNHCLDIHLYFKNVKQVSSCTGRQRDTFGWPLLRLLDKPYPGIQLSFPTILLKSPPTPPPRMTNAIK